MLWFRKVSYVQFQFFYVSSLFGVLVYFPVKCLSYPKQTKIDTTSQSTLHRKIGGNTGTCTNSLEHRNVLEQVSPRVLCKHYRVDVPRHTNSSFLNNNSFRLNHSTIYIPDTINQLEYPSYLWAFFIYHK